MPNKSKTKTGSREKILNAAQALFAEKGFHKTTTSEIASSAGVAEGTIFKNFSNKENLLFALVDEIDTGNISSLLQLAVNEETRPTLREFLKKHMGMVLNNFNLLKITLYEAQFFPELKNKFIEEVALNIFTPLENFIENKSNTGEFKDINPQIAARSFAGMIVAFIAWENILQAGEYQSFDKIEVIENVLEIFLSGIKQTG